MGIDRGFWEYRSSCGAATSALDQHRACKDLKQVHLDLFAAKGVPPYALIRNVFGWVSLVLRDRVAFLNNRFEFASCRGRDETASAYVFPVFDQFGDLADLAAWRHLSVATWQGRVSLLGEEQLFAPRFEPLKVHATAVDWFRAMRGGVYVIDLRMAAPLLREAGPLVVSTVEHGKQLRSALTLSSPEIMVEVSEAPTP